MNVAIRQAIARIDIVHGERSLGHGTGCLVTADLVLTAMHVVADRKAAGLSPAPGVIVLTFPTHRTEAAIVEGRWDQTSDWALLRCASPPPGVHPVPLSDSVADGDEWETFGFPDANSRDGLAQLGTVEDAAGTFEGVSTYQLFSRQAAAGVGAPVKGLSGGPVIVDGALVGVFRASLMREGQFNVAGTLYVCPVATVLQRCEDLLPIPDPCRGLPGLPRNPLPAVPYRFLEPFRSSDAEILFGRNREIRELYDRVTDDSSAPVVLLFGQSGAGKSSFLDAGLLPRLSSSHSIVYVRRNAAAGLLGSLVNAVVPVSAGDVGSRPHQALAETLRQAWLGIETATSRPLVVVLDQVEEAFTQPSADANELAEFAAALATLVAAADCKGRIVLAFRKEWLGEIQKPLTQRGIDYSNVFLEALDREAVVEVVTGLRRTKRLRDKYHVQEIDDHLAAAIAHDLTADGESPVAPMLQVLLSRMWREATSQNADQPQFTSELYSRLKREGFLLTDFLDQQLTALAATAAKAGGSVADVVESGLALDVLRFHVSRVGTAQECSHQALLDEYQRDDDVAWLVKKLKQLYLLSEPSGASNQGAATRLAHDTLASAIRVRYDESDRPGQRARRILEGRAGEWTVNRIGTPLDTRDLKLVEQGLTGMRAPRADEERLIGASRRLRTMAVARRRILAGAGVAAAVVIMAVAAVAWALQRQNEQGREWNAMIELAGRVPTLLAEKPAEALVAAIDAVDRSLALNNGTVLPVVQEGLATALDEARERFVWTVPDAVESSAFAHDGRIVAGTQNGAVYIFKPGQAEPQVSIKAAGDGVAVRSVAINADGSLLTAALGPQGISLWRLAGTASPVRIDAPSQPAGLATGVRFSSAQRLAAAFSCGSGFCRDGESKLYLFDVASGTSIIRDIGMSSIDGAGLAAASYEGRPIILTAAKLVRAWTEDGSQLTITRALLPALDLPTVALDAVATRTGLSAVLLRYEGQLYRWNVDPAEFFSLVPMPDATAVSFGRRGDVTLIGTVDGFVRTLGPHGEAVAPFAVAADVKTMSASAQLDMLAVSGTAKVPRVRVIDVDGLALSAGIPEPIRTYTRTVDEPGLTVQRPGFPDVPVLTIRPPRPPGSIAIGHLAFSGDGTLLVSAGEGPLIASWKVDVPRGRPWSAAGPSIVPLPDIHSGVRGIVVAGASGRAFVLDGNGIYVRDPDGRLRKTATVPEVDPYTMAVTADARIAVVLSAGATVLDPLSGRIVKSLSSDVVNPALKVASALAVDASGSRYAVGMENSTALFKMDGSAVMRVDSPVKVSIEALAFLPDGTLLTGASNGVVQRLTADGRDTQNIRVFPAGSVNALAVDPFGETVFIGGSSGIRAYDPATGSLSDLRMKGWDRAARALAVSPDGRLLAAADANGAVSLWRVGWREWLAEACDRLKGHELFTTLAKRGAAVEAIPGPDARRAFDACTRRVWNVNAQ